MLLALASFALAGELPEEMNVVRCADCAVSIGNTEIGTYRMVDYWFWGGPTVKITSGREQMTRSGASVGVPTHLHFHKGAVPLFATWDETNKTVVHFGRTPFDVGPKLFNYVDWVWFRPTDGMIVIAARDERGPMTVIWDPVGDTYRIMIDIALSDPVPIHPTK